jgi:hypothetical protein
VRLRAVCGVVFEEQQSSKITGEHVKRVMMVAECCEIAVKRIGSVGSYSEADTDEVDDQP